MSALVGRRALHACATPELLSERRPEEERVRAKWRCPRCGQRWRGEYRPNRWTGGWFSDWERVGPWRWAARW